VLLIPVSILGFFRRNRFQSFLNLLIRSFNSKNSVRQDLFINNPILSHKNPLRKLIGLDNIIQDISFIQTVTLIKSPLYHPFQMLIRQPSNNLPSIKLLDSFTLLFLFHLFMSFPLFLDFNGPDLLQDSFYLFAKLALVFLYVLDQ
jgi:hypothetical protein